MRLLSSFVAATLALAGASSPALSYGFDDPRPPAGAADASCRYADNAPGFCKLKIVSGNSIEILVWYPEGREGAKTFVYEGTCLQPGCLFVGPDLGYPTREKREIVQLSPSKLIWRTVGDANNPSVQETITLLQ